MDIEKVLGCGFRGQGSPLTQTPYVTFDSHLTSVPQKQVI